MMNTYKIFLVASLVLLSVACSSPLATQKKELQKAEIANLIRQKEFVFVAQSALPMTGRIWQLNPTHDLVISHDSIISFLPYFGRSFTAPTDPTKIGSEFTSTDFIYETSARKKSRWNISIKPNDNAAIQLVSLNITASGFATAQVKFINRQPIRFNGYITTRPRH